MPFPEGGSRYHHGNRGQNNESDIDEERQYDHQTSMTIAPDFSNAIVDDVRNRENEQRSGCRERANRDDLGTEKIGGDQARAEHDAHHQKGERYGFIHNPCFLRG